MKLSNKEIDILLNKNDFISPFKSSTDFMTFINDIKTYLMMNIVDPKRESLECVKVIIKNNGIKNPDEFLNEFIFE